MSCRRRLGLRRVSRLSTSTTTATANITRVVSVCYWRLLLLFCFFLVIGMTTTTTDYRLGVVSASQPSPIITCPYISIGDDTMELDTKDPIKRFGEISGLALSKQYFGPSGLPIAYGINDGGLRRFGIWDSGTGERLRTLYMQNDTSTFHLNLKNGDDKSDWESLGIGPCTNFPTMSSSTTEKTTCLYLANIGDNTGRSSSGRRGRFIYSILRFMEREYTNYDDHEEIPISDMQQLFFDYNHPSSPIKHADTEGLFIDQKGWGTSFVGDGGINNVDDPHPNTAGDVYWVTKWSTGNTDALTKTRIYKIPVSFWDDAVFGSNNNNQEQEVVIQHPQAFGTTSPTHTLRLHQWRSASMSSDGTLIALGSRDLTILFLRCPGQSVLDALVGAVDTSCYTWDRFSGQMETNAFAAPTTDELALSEIRNLQIPEGHNPTMYWTTLVRNPEIGTRSCPVVWFQTDNSGSGARVCKDGQGQVYDNSWCEEEQTWYADVATSTTSLAPTSLAPKTLAPTTAAPTTPIPTTAAPIAVAPTTIEPTQAPMSGAPITAAPTTKGPTQAPISGTPTIAPVKAPTMVPTKAPTMGPSTPPTSSAPTTDAPAVSDNTTPAPSPAVRAVATTPAPQSSINNEAGTTSMPTRVIPLVVLRTSAGADDVYGGSGVMCLGAAAILAIASVFCV